MSVYDHPPPTPRDANCRINCGLISPDLYSSGYHTNRIRRPQCICTSPSCRPTYTTHLAQLVCTCLLLYRECFRHLTAFIHVKCIGHLYLNCGCFQCASILFYIYSIICLIMQRMTKLCSNVSLQRWSPLKFVYCITNYCNFLYVGW